MKPQILRVDWNEMERSHVLRDREACCFEAAFMKILDALFPMQRSLKTGHFTVEWLLNEFPRNMLADVT
jgi:hypothetical protein